MAKVAVSLSMVFVALMIVSCAPPPSSSDQQREKQERILAEAAAQVGTPSLKNFRELKMVKDIYELRDQTGLVTYTYLYNEMTGKMIFFCDSLGYGLPYATQFSAPVSMQNYRVEAKGSGQTDNYGIAELPQAEPNGLFVPESAEGTWVMCQDPDGADARPIYVEPRIIVSQFKLPCHLLQDGCPAETADEPDPE